MALTPIRIAAYSPDTHEPISAIMRTPGIVEHFASQGPPEEQLADSECDHARCALALRDDRPVGAAIVVLVPAEPRWAMVRIGVLPEERRRGVGTELLREVERLYRALDDAERPREIRIAAVIPSHPAEGFAAAHGFTVVRRFAHMLWPGDRAVLDAAWPAGVRLRTFDGSHAMLRDWTNAFNAGFGDHWGAFPVTTEEARAISRQPHFVPEGLALAYRGNDCVGFCRTATRPDHGEIALLAIVPEARGIGLGRALLRWGVAWLVPRTPRIVLIVDEENEPATQLYRAEGFGTDATRVIWSRALDCARASSPTA